MRVTSEDDALFPGSGRPARRAPRAAAGPDGRSAHRCVCDRPRGRKHRLARGVPALPGRWRSAPARSQEFRHLRPRVSRHRRGSGGMAGIRPLGVRRLLIRGNSSIARPPPSMRNSPDEALAREIRLSLIQLAHAGTGGRASPRRGLDRARSHRSRGSTNAFKAPVDVLPRPTPVLPNPLSKLLPADVRAARRAALRRRNLILGVAAVALIYLGLIGWLGYGLWQGMAETKKLLSQARGGRTGRRGLRPPHRQMGRTRPCHRSHQLAGGHPPAHRRLHPAQQRPAPQDCRYQRHGNQALKARPRSSRPSTPSASNSRKTPTSPTSPGRPRNPTNPPAAGNLSSPAKFPPPNPQP